MNLFTIELMANGNVGKQKKVKGVVMNSFKMVNRYREGTSLRFKSLVNASCNGLHTLLFILN